ncbi:MAG: response regulator transcription factor [Spirochaetales bacterium]|nr:response regulator transcription factor [Spirochaetales bacterium]
MDKKNILIIEDELGVQITLEDRLTSEGYNVEISGDGLAGEKIAMKNEHDVILLDVMLPGKDGFSICNDLRKAGIVTPILMLTARNTTIDTVMGLRGGADDYLAKPFDMQVLLARIEALLRRTQVVSSEEDDGPKIITFSDYELDRESGSLNKNGEAVELNAQEYKLLEYLALNKGKIVSRNKILDDVWGYENEVTTRTVDVHVAKLRQRIGESDNPKHIITYRGRGYKFVM